MLKLYGHDPSPFVRRVRILMTELGLRFERDTRAWKEPSPELLSESPIQRLPMLDRGEGHAVRYVYDSRSIAEVLYEAAAQRPSGAPKDDVLPLQPTLWNPALHDDDRNVLSVVDAAIDSAVNVYLIELDGVTSDSSPYLQRQNQRVARCLEWLDRRYADRDTLDPSQLAFVDVALVSGLGWLRFRKRAELESYAALCRVEARLEERPSFAATRPG